MNYIYLVSNENWEWVHSFIRYTCTCNYVTQQLYKFTKRLAPADDHHDGASEMAKKLMKYSVSVPEYITAYNDTDVAW